MYQFHKGGRFLYITHPASILLQWNHRQLKRLFGMASALFLLYMLSYMLTHMHELHAQSDLFMVITISLVMLLIAVHVHLFMVRIGVVPHLIARPKREEFHSLVSDIVDHDEFVKLKDYHHHTTPIFDHVMRVAFLSYATSKALGFDYRSAARGGLLHEFFLYDWRERKATDSHRSRHGTEHPNIALANARTHFTVNDREADIIVKHMYPKTRALPRYRESFVVSIMDKIATVVEYFCHNLQCWFRSTK